MAYFHQQRIGNRSVPFLVFLEGRKGLSAADYFIFAIIQHLCVMMKSESLKDWISLVPDSYGTRIGLPWSAQNRSACWMRLIGTESLRGSRDDFSPAKIDKAGRLPIAFLRYVSPCGEALTPNELRGLSWLTRYANEQGVCDTNLKQLAQFLDLGETATSEIRCSLERKGVLALLGPQKIQLMSLHQLGLFDIATDSFKTVCEHMDSSRPLITTSRSLNLPSPDPNEKQAPDQRCPVDKVEEEPRVASFATEPPGTLAARKKARPQRAYKDLSLRLIRQNGPRTEPVCPILTLTDFARRLQETLGGDRSQGSIMKAASDLSFAVTQELMAYEQEYCFYCNDLLICDLIDEQEKDVRQQRARAERAKNTQLMFDLRRRWLVEVVDGASSFEEAADLLEKNVGSDQHKVLEASKFGPSQMSIYWIETLSNLDTQKIQSVFTVLETQVAGALSKEELKDVVVRRFAYQFFREYAGDRALMEWIRTGLITNVYGAFLEKSIIRRRRRIQSLITSWYGSEIDWGTIGARISVQSDKPECSESYFRTMDIPVIKPVNPITFFNSNMDSMDRGSIAQLIEKIYDPRAVET